MGVRRTVFLGGQTLFWTGQKAISTLFIPKFYKLAILCLKFHKCQIPGPGKCLVMPIGADALVPVNIYGVFFLGEQQHFQNYINFMLHKQIKWIHLKNNSLQILQATGFAPPHSSHCLDTDPVLCFGGIFFKTNFPNYILFKLISLCR